jgi:hypothetical protein
VLFLTSRGPSIPYIFGLSQGAYRISRTQGRVVVTPSAVIAGASDSGPAIVRGDPARRSLPLDEFARQVRAIMERPR